MLLTLRIGELWLSSTQLGLVLLLSSELRTRLSTGKPLFAPCSTLLYTLMASLSPHLPALLEELLPGPRSGNRRRSVGFLGTRTLALSAFPVFLPRVAMSRLPLLARLDPDSKRAFTQPSPIALPIITSASR